MINYDRYSEDSENKGWYDPLKVPFSNQMQLIEGFKEALMMMNVGDKVYAFIRFKGTGKYNSCEFGP